MLTHLKKSCKFRHVRICSKFTKNLCGFFNTQNLWVPYDNCSLIHPPMHPPASHLPLHPPTHPPHIPNIQQELTKLEAKFLESTTKWNSKIQSLEAEMAAIKQKPSVERLEGQIRPSQESVMVVTAGEAFPPGNIISQQDEHNEESCLAAKKMLNKTTKHSIERKLQAAINSIHFRKAIKK